MATTECHFGSGLNSSSGGELKLYLGCRGSTAEVETKVKIVFDICLFFSNLFSLCPLPFSFGVNRS